MTIFLLVAECSAGLIFYREADCTYREEKAKLYRPKAEKMHTMAEAEKAWIREKQGSDGRLVMSGGEDTNPYFACLAAQGLLAGDVSEADLDTVRYYIDWHSQRFMEWDGEIPDFTVRDGVESVSKPDSVDSYIAVFLSLLCRKVEITGTLSDQEREVVRLGMEKLEDLTVDGLTCVREGDSRMYLMDNIEVLACYQDLQCLADRTAGLEEIAEEAGARAEKTGAAILEQLWNAEAFRYEVGAQTGGDTIRSKHPERFYPDGVVQIYGMAFGQYLTGREDAVKLYERFCDTFAWETMEMDGVSFYWSEPAMAAARLGDLERAEIYLETYEKCTGTERSYPLHIGTAGWTAKVCACMEESYKERMESSLLQDIVNKIAEGGSDGRL